MVPQGLDVGLSWLKTLGVDYRNGEVVLKNCAKKYLGSWRRHTTIPLRKMSSINTITSLWLRLEIMLGQYQIGDNH